MFDLLLVPVDGQGFEIREEDKVTFRDLSSDIRQIRIKSLYCDEEP